MIALLPPELLDLIQQKCPCRETQIRQLATYYNNTFPSPPILVAYGFEQSSRRDVIYNVLQAREIDHAVVKSKECLSQRHLLSKIFAASITALGLAGQVEQFEKTDSINALLGNLRKLFERLDGRKLVVVIEDVDDLRQSGPTLLPALARLGDLVCAKAYKHLCVLTGRLGTWAINDIDLKLSSTAQYAPSWRPICPLPALHQI